MKFFHVNWDCTGCLCGIQNKKELMFLAEVAKLLYRHDCSTDIGGMQTDEKFRIRAEKLFCFFYKKRSVSRAWNPVKSDTICLKLYERPHHCVVLHGRDQDMVTGLQKSLQKNIQTGGDIWCEDHIFTLTGSKMEQVKKLFSCLKDLFLHRIGSLIAATVYIHGRTIEIIVNCLCDRRGFGIGSTCLIQIYFCHKTDLFSDIQAVWIS